MGYVSAGGATSAGQRGATITFEPLARLVPDARATWIVNVRGREAGDVRFQVNMNSDQLDRDLTETEATNIYRYE